MPYGQNVKSGSLLSSELDQDQLILNASFSNCSTINNNIGSKLNSPTKLKDMQQPIFEVDVRKEQSTKIATRITKTEN